MADQKEKEKAVYAPTTAEVDRERRLDQEELSADEFAEKYGTDVTGREYAVEGNDTGDYVGVSPEYMTYARDTDKPLRSEDNAEAELEERFTKGGAIAEQGEVFGGVQTDGGGSSVPTVYATYSGENFSDRVVTAEEAEKEGKKLQPSDTAASTATEGAGKQVAKKAVAPSGSNKPSGSN